MEVGKKFSKKMIFTIQMKMDLGAPSHIILTRVLSSLNFCVGQHVSMSAFTYTETHCTHTVSVYSETIARVFTYEYNT